MSWIVFVLIGQFLNALVVVGDKHIVTAKIVSRPIIYTFYVGLLSMVALFALPFGVTLPSSAIILPSLLAGLFFVLSIYLLYESLKNSDPSDTLPVIGGVSALITFFGSYVILGEGLPSHFFTGFFILIVGMVFISHFKFNRTVIYELVGSGVFFGMSTILLKVVFLNDTFINGFFWSRMANVFVVLLLLLLPGVYGLLVNEERAHTAVTNKNKKRPSTSSKILFVLGNKALAGVAFFCILIAIKFGNVSMINALAATQYIFLFIFAIIWKKALPGYFSDSTYKHELIHKVFATSLIVIGFIVLFI